MPKLSSDRSVWKETLRAAITHGAYAHKRASATKIAARLIDNRDGLPHPRAANDGETGLMLRGPS